MAEIIPRPLDKAVESLNSKIADSNLDLGALSAMPSLGSYGNGFYCFSLSGQITIGTTILPAGTRIFGYKNLDIFHGTAISINNTLSLRYQRGLAEEWMIVNNLSWTYINQLQTVNNSLQFPLDAKEILFVQYNSGGGTAFASLYIPNSSMPSAFAVYSDAGHAIISRSSNTLTLTSNTDNSIVKVYYR